jgi:MSHA biogenesis protein MshE
MVGEMRDQETAEIGLRAAMTGHLVLSTLHTNDAVSTALRLLDMGAEGFVVGSALQAILAQRLVRRICNSCIEDDPLDMSMRNWLDKAIGPGAGQLSFKRGSGCHHCHNSGYQGRVGVFELLEIDILLADTLRRGDAAGFAEQARRQPGFKPLTLAAFDFARDGITSMEEVLRIAGQVDEVVDLDSLTTPLFEDEINDNGAVFLQSP